MIACIVQRDGVSKMKLDKSVEKCPFVAMHCVTSLLSLVTNILKSPDFTKHNLSQSLPDFNRNSPFFTVVNVNKETIVFKSSMATTPKYDLMYCSISLISFFKAMGLGIGRFICKSNQNPS